MKNKGSSSSVLNRSFYFFASACLFLLMMTCQAEAAVRQTPDSLPIEGRYAISAAIGHDEPGYHARMAAGFVEAENTGHGLSVRFSAGGVELAAGKQSFALRPVMWGYGDELTLIQPGVPQAVGNLVTAQRGGVSEWYVNGPLGLQQGFTVTEAPQSGSGPLVIDMAIVGARAGRIDEDGRGVMLTGADGAALYRYSGLVVRDADGREAQAWLETKDGLVRICVNDAGMSYPLYIDPVIQMAKLTASDGVVADYFGYSIAVSGDTVVTGVPYAGIGGNVSQGSAYVFVKPAGGWATTSGYTAKLTAADGVANDSFGHSVAISGDTMAVGAPYVNFGQGAAYVFVKPAGGWATTSAYTAKLTASDGVFFDDFGYSVTISGDTVVVGAYGVTVGGHAGQGAAYVFVKPAGVWATTSIYKAKLTASDGDAGDYFGYSVAISGDTVVVGAPFADIGGHADQGAAYVFVKPAGVWATTSSFTAKLTALDGAASDYFGNSVAISGDTMVAGASYANIGGNTNQGAAYVFVKPAGVWATTSGYIAKLTAADGLANDHFGNSVAISGDTMVFGAYYAAIGGNTNQGAAYVFMKPAGGWADMIQMAKHTALDGDAFDLFGYCVAISGDTMAVGAYQATIGVNTFQGAAYVFKTVADEPTVQASDLTFSAVSANSMTVSWTPGTGTGSIVQMKQGSAVDGIPVDAFGYTANAAFGSGAQIGTGNYVIYSGNGDTVAVTGLSPATTYHVAVYDYSSSPPSEAVNYRQTRPATGSQITNAALAAVADNYTTAKNKTLVVEAPGVLANDAGSGLTAISVSDPAHGVLNLAADGSFIYIPVKGFKGADSFTYKVSDGISESGPATVTITVGKKCPMVKLYGDDSAQVELMRRYRDEVLETTVAGKLVVDLYYGLAPIVDQALENPWLQQKARRVVDGLLPVVEKRLK